MRITTYNIHGSVGTDRTYEPGRIVEVIRGIEPDILGLQEVRLPGGSVPDILERLQTAYPAYSIVFGMTLEDERGTYGNALVSRYPIRAYRDLSLEIAGTHDTRTASIEDRRAIIADLIVPDSQPVTVIVTHLSLERWARRKQADRLITGIESAVDVKTEPAVFLGDFNEWFFADRFLRRIDRHFATHIVRRTFPSRFPFLPLDRVWITGQLRDTSNWVHKRWPARVASDHLPLCVDCAYPRD